MRQESKLVCSAHSTLPLLSGAKPSPLHLCTVSVQAGIRHSNVFQQLILAFFYGARRVIDQKHTHILIDSP